MITVIMKKTIAFCGHSSFVGTKEDKERLLALLESLVGDEPVEFFLGEYGGFDRFAATCAKAFRRHHPRAKLIWVVAYPSTNVDNDGFDLILYPPIEHIPPRFAIYHRNRWVAEQADILIAYVSHSFGGAYEMYRHAKKNRKEIYNLFTI